MKKGLSYNLKGIIPVLFFLLTLSCFSGNDKKIDSLYTVLKTSKNDTLKINAGIKLASILCKDDTVKGFHELRKTFYNLGSVNNDNFYFKSIEKMARVCYGNNMLHQARIYWDMGLKKAKEKNNVEWQARFYARIANYLQGEDYSKQCIAYFDSALMVAKDGNEKLLSEILMKKGRAHYDIGEYKPAMDLYIQSQRLFEKNKWYNVEYGHLLHFIGSVFKQQNFYEKALEYYEKELALAKQIKNKGLEAEGYYLCASMYGTMGNLDKEMEYVQNALRLFQEENNLRMVGLMYSNMSANYSDRKLYDEAIKSCEKALQIYDEIGETDNQAATFRTLGTLYRQTGKPKKALEYLKKAMASAMQVETKQLLNRSEITEAMAYVYSDMGDYKSAFDLLLEYRSLNDSLNNQSNAEYLHTLEKQYETEKKEKEIALLNADKKLQAEEIEKKETQTRNLVIAIVLILLIAGISIFAFIGKRKTSRILSKQVDEINYQNAVIKEKNKDITDSIQYAKRLQEAVFPEADTLNNYFAESFVLFRPKDIVSGDFYWFDQINNKTLLVIGDCTGHGVPGAFMSILGHNLLNQIILEENVTSPGEILTLLDKRVTNALNKRGSKQEYNDGMDIAICVLDKSTNKLFFSGANRPLVVKRDKELIELKPNKFAVGGLNDGRTKVFGNQMMEVKENDVLYLFSDGYYDQFGGPRGKKFKYKQLVDHLSDIASKPLKEQESILAYTLENWRGSLEQIDDICVIGVKI